MAPIEIFQLHHTGIKTCTDARFLSSAGRFQLHHTGIKTESVRLQNTEALNFNCTIQELKRAGQRERLPRWRISIAPYRN